MTLKDAFMDPKGNKKIENINLVIREEKEYEQPTSHLKTNLFNVGSNIHDSAMVGSSVMTMQIDIPAFFTKLDAINDITTNANRIADFFGKLKDLTDSMNHGERRKEARNKILAAYKRGRGIK